MLSLPCMQTRIYAMCNIFVAMLSMRHAMYVIYAIYAMYAIYAACQITFHIHIYTGTTAIKFSFLNQTVWKP